jgi:hypothetical protein
MSCCGNKREQIRQQRTVSVPLASAPAMLKQTLMPVVFKGSGSYLVTGEHSRSVYHFSQKQPERWIDPRDAEALLRTNLFQSKS